jgi:hypothetical protein
MAAGWLLAASATTAVGLAAIDTLGAGLFGDARDDRPLSAADVQRRLVAESATPSPVETSASAGLSGGASPSATRTPTVSRQPPASSQASRPAGGASVTRALAVPGGTVNASCSGGQATLVAWSPTPGFRVVGAERGPAAAVTIKFKRDHEEVHAVINCVGGEPTATATVIPTDD